MPHISIVISAIKVSCQNCRYLQRLSKKSYFSIFPNFAYNKIKYLEATKSPILGFSTVSQHIQSFQEPKKVVISNCQSIFRSPFDPVKLLKNQAKTVNPFKKSTLLNLKWFQKLILCPKVRRKPMKKRSIHTVVCEHFEEAFNAAFRH